MVIDAIGAGEVDAEVSRHWASGGAHGVVSYATVATELGAVLGMAF
ncbi:MULTISPECIES: hypothetical protein [Amycolatopsis]|uniref:Uncharacterized protein n=1 Tax=Amycolatopsis thermalba TaxID=944492 RepID=A0ABY4NU84_9PSEU|nr:MULTISPECIES: hypothetical protein [Amycolatopsis]UQS23624.1 hypothetical protein L1857_12700 [Amycolatopsis thermalba]